MNENLEIPQPDPSWDYYVLYHSLHHIKAKIDAALKIMIQSEYGTAETDCLIKECLEPASGKLIEIVESFPYFDDEESPEL